MKTLEILYSRHNINSPPRHYPRHTVHFTEMTLVIKGILEYTVNGQKYTVCDGDMIYIPTDSVCERENSNENVDYISFNFTIDDEVNLPVFFKDAVHSETVMLISAYDRINRRSYLDNKEKNAHILACIIAVLEDRVRTSNYNPLTLKIMKHIHTNLDQKITLTDIGNLTFFSPVYCDTVFKRETGKSIIDYLLDERIEWAKMLLLEGTLSLQQVSERTGFSDYNYFSRVFRSRSGYPPSMYRKMMFEDRE